MPESIKNRKTNCTKNAQGRHNGHKVCMIRKFAAEFNNLLAVNLQTAAFYFFKTHIPRQGLKRNPFIALPPAEAAGNTNLCF